MEFYKSIASKYDKIFPYSPIQAKFVESEIPENNLSILDIGCGTGNLSLKLAEKYDSILGIDLDGEMLDLAKQKNQLSNLLFKKLSMLDLTKNFEEESQNNILCFGNTIVHLFDIEQINDFLKQSFEILKPNGKLLIQLINYDRVLSKKVDHLPTINNEEISFERLYSFDKEKNKIVFKTILTDSETNTQITNNIELIPLLKKELLDILESCGFSQIKCYGNFAKEQFDIESSIPLVISASKK